MASLKSLAGQTLWYGLSNIGAKLLNSLLTPLITHLLNTSSGVSDYGDFSVLYACISFANVIYTYGLETAYFRFSASGADQGKLFQTTFSSLLGTTVILSAILIYFNGAISRFTDIADHPEYITWAVLIVAVDTMAAIPFARLRQEGRPRKYAFTRLAGIVVNIFLTVFFMQYSPGYVAAHPGTQYAAWYAHNSNVGFLILANLAQSVVTFLLLYREWLSYRFRFDAALWRKIIAYCAPMIIVGLGGMVNETIDRIMLLHLTPGTYTNAKMMVGIYAANYKLAIFITLFITAFRMSAEPFFFSQSADKNAPKTYARVMKWFVIILCVAFLFTALFLDVWKYYIGSRYWSGLAVVPVLLGANVCLGIYYNLSVWYKITDRMRMGMYITLVGAAITLVLNFAFIPAYGMYACAWATLAAYGSMMVISYFMGQRYFPVPYPMKKLLSYLAIMLLLFGAEQLLVHITPNIIVRVGGATILMFLFLRLVAAAEKDELKGMPVVGRWIK